MERFLGRKNNDYGRKNNDYGRENNDSAYISRVLVMGLLWFSQVIFLMDPSAIKF
jgi:hypothetical protein